MSERNTSPAFAVGGLGEAGSAKSMLCHHCLCGRGRGKEGTLNPCSYCHLYAAASGQARIEERNRLWPWLKCHEGCARTRSWDQELECDCGLEALLFPHGLTPVDAAPPVTAARLAALERVAIAAAELVASPVPLPLHKRIGSEVRLKKALESLEAIRAASDAALEAGGQLTIPGPDGHP
jgi:hypothetical protein